jgi:xanthine/CO dehydrogenase XdhC/CoxF family maturation factor
MTDAKPQFILDSDLGVKELRKILSHPILADGKGDAAALLAVVQVEGSAYRRAGARMLALRGERLEGSISGGCLEKDAALHAEKAVRLAKPTLLTYRSEGGKADELGMGLGCQGTICVLVEPVNERLREEFAFLSGVLRDGRGGVLAKVIRSESRPLGSLLFLSGRGDRAWRQNESPFQNTIVDEALKSFVEKKSQAVVIGEDQIFFEYLPPRVEITVFGTGADVAPLLRLGREVGFHFRIVDCRGNAARPAWLSTEDDFTSIRMATASERFPWLAPESFVVVMTHHYATDLDLLKKLLPLELRYLGLLGSRRRGKLLLSDLVEQGVSLGPAQYEKLHTPIGLDLGAETPEEISLSILAEIQSVRKLRNGISLKEKERALP